MNAKRIGYWLVTGVLALGMAAGGVIDWQQGEMVAEGFKKLGYPLYLGKILGFWKIAGALAILAPGLPRLKEWAYAGFLFNLTGAAASHLFAGEPPQTAVPALIGVALLAASHQLRPADRTLPGPAL